MSTWLQDLERNDPKLAHAYKVVGDLGGCIGYRTCLRNMVSALSGLTQLNTRDDNLRLAAARYILSRKQ